MKTRHKCLTLVGDITAPVAAGRQHMAGTLVTGGGK